MLPPHYANQKEAMFYKDDIDFMRFHKRTSSNVHRVLQQLLESEKQTVSQGIKKNYMITVSHVKLNRACSVVDAWWQINAVSRITDIE